MLTIITPSTVVFPETAVPGDTITTTVTVTGVTQPPNINQSGGLTVDFNGGRAEKFLPVTQQVAGVVPTFTVTDSPGFDFAIVDAAPTPAQPDKWTVTVIITKL